MKVRKPSRTKRLCSDRWRRVICFLLLLAKHLFALRFRSLRRRLLRLGSSSFGDHPASVSAGTTHATSSRLPLQLPPLFIRLIRYSGLEDSSSDEQTLRVEKC